MLHLGVCFNSLSFGDLLNVVQIVILCTIQHSETLLFLSSSLSVNVWQVAFEFSFAEKILPVLNRLSVNVISIISFNGNSLSYFALPHRSLQFFSFHCVIQFYYIFLLCLELIDRVFSGIRSQINKERRKKPQNLRFDCGFHFHLHIVQARRG